MTDREFEQFFREQFTPLSSLAYSVVKDRDEAKDIVQHVFLNFWQKRHELQVKGTYNGYFYRSVLNASLTRLKQQKKLTAIQEAPPQMAVNGIEQVQEDFISRQLQAAISDLPPVCQKVFRLSRFSDLSNKEIAEQLNISVKAVEKHITKALKSLREAMEPHKAHYFESLALLFLLINIRMGWGFFNQICH